MNELLNAYKLAHFVAESGFAGAQRNLSLAGFDSLFENGGSLRNISVAGPREGTRPEVGPQDQFHRQAKLDEYLGSVRDVERASSGMRADKDRPRASPDPADRYHDAASGKWLAEDLREHIRLMSRHHCAGFQTDKTRVASLLLARDLSALYYPFLG